MPRRRNSTSPTMEGGEEPSSEQQDLPRSMSDPDVKQPTLWKSAKQESPVEERDHLNIDDEGADWLESNLRETSEKNGGQIHSPFKRCTEEEGVLVMVEVALEQPIFVVIKPKTVADEIKSECILKLADRRNMPREEAIQSYSSYHLFFTKGSALKKLEGFYHPFGRFRRGGDALKFLCEVSESLPDRRLRRGASSGLDCEQIETRKESIPTVPSLSLGSMMVREHAHSSTASHEGTAHVKDLVDNCLKEFEKLPNDVKESYASAKDHLTQASELLDPVDTPRRRRTPRVTPEEQAQVLHHKSTVKALNELNRSKRSIASKLPLPVHLKHSATGAAPSPPSEPAPPPPAWANATVTSPELSKRNEGSGCVMFGLSHSALAGRRNSHAVMVARQARTRAQAVKELLETERQYFLDIILMKKLYYTPLQWGTIITSSQLDDVFANISEIVSVANEMRVALDAEGAAKSADQRIGRVFLDLAPKFYCYEEYCLNQGTASSMAKQLQTRNKSFRKFCEDSKNHAECQGLDLDGFLIKPLQRMCKYPLLLKVILRNTPEDHVDYESLASAVSRFERILADINEAKAMADNESQVLEIQQKFLPGSDGPVELVTADRLFLAKGDFKKIMITSSKSSPVDGGRRLYLFSDIVLIAAPASRGKFYLREVLPLKTCIVTPVTTGDPSFKILCGLGEDISHISILCPSREILSDWTDRLNSAIADSLISD